MRPVLLTLACCCTAFAMELHWSVIYETQERENRKAQAYQFLLAHPEVMQRFEKPAKQSSLPETLHL